MPPFSRRNLLKAGAAAAVLVPLLSRKSARATAFGEFPDPVKDRMLPADRRVKRVLEVFLYGGLSCWESLYTVPEYGRSNDPVEANRYTQFHAFADTPYLTPEQAATRCGNSGSTGVNFATDALGKTVQLGPFAQKLAARTDLVDRMRLLCLSHNLEPHEAAIPLALTGKAVGSPTMAGLGTHIQRFLTDKPRLGRQAPDSYVFSTGGLPGDNVAAAFATGMHPGRARPLRIKIDNVARLNTLLARERLGTLDERIQYDTLVGAYIQQYQDQLNWKGVDLPARSSRLADLSSSAGSVHNSESVRSVMEARFFEPVESTVCNEQNLNTPRMSFQLAAHLLTHPVEPASYVCVVDTGLIEASGGGGYDSHNENSREQSRNLTNMFNQLTAIINAPGENDPRKLNLDDTLIILNTEFGRTPWQQERRDRSNSDGSDGRNHFPYGYVNALIGGPVRERGIVGALGASGYADTFVTPSETRIAALLSLGIWPFSPEAFGVSDVQDAGTEPDAVTDVTKRVLGVQL